MELSISTVSTVSIVSFTASSNTALRRGKLATISSSRSDSSLRNERGMVEQGFKNAAKVSVQLSWVFVPLGGSGAFCVEVRLDLEGGGSSFLVCCCVSTGVQKEMGGLSSCDLGGGGGLQG